MCTAVKDSFWVVINSLPLGANAPFENLKGDKDDVCQTLLEDDREDEGALIISQSILRMRMEKA